MTVDSKKMALAVGKLIVDIPMVSKNGNYMYVLKGTITGIGQANNVNQPTNQKIDNAKEYGHKSCTYTMSSWGETSMLYFYGERY